MRLQISGLILLLLPLNVLAQTDSTSTSGVKEHHALYAGAGYGNNMIYLGSTISRDLPYGYGALSYVLGGELMVTGSSFYMPDLDPAAPAFNSISISYNHEFTKWLDISAGAYRYMVKPTLTDTLFNNFNYADITLGIDWKILYTEVSYGGFLIKDAPTYLQVKNSHYFETPSFFKGKANISFYPYANILFGGLVNEKITEGTEVITTTSTIINPASLSGSGTGIGAGSGQGAGTGQGSGNSGTGSGSSETTTETTTTTTVPSTNIVYTESFGPIDMEIGLPVSFNLSFMSLEADISYLLPLYSDSYYPAPKGFVVMFSAFFKIF